MNSRRVALSDIFYQTRFQRRTIVKLFVGFVILMAKSSNSPTVRCFRWPEVEGHQGRVNDVVFCGSEGQQHVVFFPGDVQVRTTRF